MVLAISGFLHSKSGAVRAGLPHRVDFHIETSSLGTSDMKRPVAVCFVALNRRPPAFLFAQVTGELPSRRRNVLHSLHGLQEHGVGKAHFWDPYGTDDMGPTSVAGLFECTSPIRAEDTIDGS